MKPKACVVVSCEMFVRTFLVRQLVAMQEHYEVTVVANTTNPAFLEELGVAGRLHVVAIERAPAPLMDLRCLIALIRLMRRERFALVHSMTPKTGLLAMIAAWIARAPVRLHTFTGQVWATRSGIRRAVLKCFDQTIARAATFVLADSQSQRSFLASQGVVAASKVAVLAHGSVSGVDAAKFRPEPSSRRRVRASLGIGMTDVVLLFVGRLTRDKGVLDLARAFAILAERRSDIRLLVVGPDEERLSAEISHLCGRHRARLHVCNFTNAPQDFMAASDILCLPSYREGFGTVIIEAAAAGLPAVASRIYGVVDAVVDESTGLLHRPGDLDALGRQLERLIDCPALRTSLGVAARARAVRDFSQSTVTSAVLDLYARLIADTEQADAAGTLIRPASGGSLGSPARVRELTVGVGRYQ
jgi:glycosyltransferase involved in cell wall biosynthesis